MAFDPNIYMMSVNRRKNKLITKYGDNLGIALEEFLVARDEVSSAALKDTSNIKKFHDIIYLAKREASKYIDGSRDLNTAISNIKLLTADIRSIK